MTYPEVAMSHSLIAFHPRLWTVTRRLEPHHG